jgi:hypothetical protein
MPTKIQEDRTSFKGVHMPGSGRLTAKLPVLGPPHQVMTDPPVVIPDGELAIQLRIALGGVSFEDYTESFTGMMSSTPATVVAVSLEELIDPRGEKVPTPVVTAWSTRPISTTLHEEVAQALADESHLESGVLTYRNLIEVDPHESAIKTVVLEPEEFDSSLALQTFRDETTIEMIEVATSVGRWLWWRSGGQGIFSVTELNLYWSLDGIHWVLIPKAARNRIESTRHWHLSADIETEFTTIGDRVDEPASAWELYREAWGALPIRAKSSVLLGIAAAEVGFKEWVSRVAPDCTWLLETGPSPSLADMVAKFLPQLLADKLDLECSPRLSTSSSIRKVVEQVQARNTVAHVPGSSSRHKQIRDLLSPWDDSQRAEFLLCVADFLWLLDFLWLRYTGRDA